MAIPGLTRLVRGAVTMLMLAPVISGCAASVGGSAVAVSATAAVQDQARVSVAATQGSEPAVAAASSRDIPSDVPSSAETAGWSAVIEAPADVGMVSPTGDLVAQVDGQQVCFIPSGQPAVCGSVAAGAVVTFAVFSQDGEYLLVVAGQATLTSAYVFRTVDATSRVLGPTGVVDLPPGSNPPTWKLSSAVWGADGSSVLLVPWTDGPDGPVLAFDLNTGDVREVLGLDAGLANSSPSLWTTQVGLAIVPNTGDLRSSLWWADFATGRVDELATYDEPGGSLLLSGADPGGEIILACPRQPNGSLGATLGVAVDGSQNARILKDSGSCAGAVFSPDGRHLAMTARVDDDYQLMVADRQTGVMVFTTSLLFPKEPAAPPYLTWLGDVIVATDTTGDWVTPTIIIRLRR